MTLENIAAVRIGIVGMGNMGSVHARSLLAAEVPGAELAGVCDMDPKRLDAFAKTPGWNDAEQMIAEGGLDAVLIAAPHYSHVPLGISALNAGLHVLMEKPIAVHKADAERLIAAHKNPRQVFSAVFNQRTDPRYQWVKESIADGRLGRINRVSWIITDWFRTESYYRNNDWRATWAGGGAGVLLNQSPHQLDLWQWMFGMPHQVRAFCHLGRFHDIEVEDDVTAYLQYESGMNGIFTTTTGEAPGTNRLEIAAENGRVIVEGNEIRFDRNQTPTSDFSAACEKPFDAPPAERETIAFDSTGEQHVGILKNFVAAIRGSEPLIAPAREGIHSVELGNAMLFSGLTNQTIELPLDGAAYESKLNELIRTSTYKKKPGNAGKVHVQDMGKSF